LIFLFAPFGILRQFALFSAMGLLSSYITVLCLLPELTVLINKKNPIKAKAQAEKTGFGILHGKVLAPNGKRALLAGLCIIFLGAIFFGHGGAARQSTLKIKNDLRSLYTVPPELLESERIASSVMNYNSENWFLVSGSTLQELLEHEEILLARLNEEGSFLGISRFIPPEKTQAARYQAAAALLPLAEAQYEALGFPPESAGLFLKDYEALAGHYVLPSSVPPMASEILSSLLIRVGGQNSGERWYSAIMPLAQAGTKAGASGAAENPASLADQYEWAAVLNRVEDISVELDSLTGAMIKLLGAAFGLIVLGLIFYYRNVLQILKIAAIPVFAALASLAVHALSGLFLSFFSVSGFVLVLGLGLDYMFYLTENSAPAENPQSSTVKLAVILSYATTAISFGALVFSSFMPARLLALSIFPGLGAAFMWAMLVKD
jgi:predicted exporter